MSVLTSSFTNRRLSLLEERYSDIEEIGFGGMGRVYKAFDKFLLKNVAIKVLARNLASDNQLVRFQNEARLASKLSHQNIVKVFDFGVASDEDLYMVMDLVKGKNLQEYINGGDLSLDDIISITLDVCDALHHAHYNGIIHRDVKPNNIMLEEAVDGYLTAKLVDFGLAKTNSQAVQYVSNGNTVLTPLYSSPEQIHNHTLDHRTDIYSLGCVMYSMVTGSPPFEGENALNTMEMHVNSKAPVISCADVDSEMLNEIERIIQKAISKSPDDRFQDISELKHELLVLSDIENVESAVEYRSNIVFDSVNTHFMQSSKRLLVVLCSLVAVVSLFSIFLIAQGGPSTKRLPVMPAGIVSMDALPDSEFIRYNDKGKISWLGSGITNDQDFERLHDHSFNTLELHAVEIEGTGFRFIEGKPIYRLAIQGSKIADENLGYIGSLRKLNSLEIVFSTITDKGIENIGQLPSLTTLNLQGCRAITNDAIPLIKKRFPNLRYLGIGGTKIDGKGIRQLNGFKSLVKLSVDGLNLIDRDVKNYISKKPYSQIELSNNPGLTDLTLEYLGRMKTLKLLKINSANSFSSKGIEDFKRLKADCSIHFKSTNTIIKKKQFSQLFESVISNGIGTTR